MSKQIWKKIGAVIGIVALIWILICMIGCAGSTLSGDVIKENKTIDDPQVACLQDAMKKQSVFKHTFKYDDSYPPTLYVYITGEWSSLDDNAKESTLNAIGKEWQRCNPDNMAVLTVLAYDSNDIPVMAVYVTRED